MTDKELDLDVKLYTAEMDFVLAAYKLTACYEAIDDLRWWQWIKAIRLTHQLEPLRINYEQAKQKLFALYDEIDA